MLPTAIIADDEVALRRYLRERLAQAWPELTIFAEGENGDQAVALIEAHSPTIAFLDIRMPGLSGIDVARAVAGRCWIVFVTAYDQYAVEAFEREAVDYLLKPVEQERLESTVRRLQARIASPPSEAQAELLGGILTEALARKQPAFLKWLRVQYRDGIRLLPVEDVIYFKASDKYTLVITDGGEALIRKSIRGLSEELDPGKFWRIHRGSIVNASRIDAVKSSLTGGGTLHLKGCDQSLAVSRSYMYLFKQM
jgi:DNA-binding LytR/AlgR family response regulator